MDAPREDGAVEPGWFVHRENRFVATVARADAPEARAYVPNTARLVDLLVPGAPVLLARSADPRRRTQWTLTRVWDGTWVAIDAAAAADLVAEALTSGTALPGWPTPVDVRREVPVGAHRLDLAIDLPDGREALVEVKSLTRAQARVATLSHTPSSRGAAQLALLGEHATAGTPTAVVFVVQRGDVDLLDLDAPADPGWQAAVAQARAAGVDISAFRCTVTADTLRLDAPIAVRPPT